MMLATYAASSRAQVAAIVRATAGVAAGARTAMRPH